MLACWSYSLVNLLHESKLEMKTDHTWYHVYLKDSITCWIWHSWRFYRRSKSCPLKEWVCDSSCIFLLIFINWRLEYLLHGDSSRRCYRLYNKYLLSVFYNLVNFIYPLPTAMFTDSHRRCQRAVLYVLYCALVRVFFFSVSFTFSFSLRVCFIWFSVTLWLFFS